MITPSPNLITSLQALSDDGWAEGFNITWPSRRVAEEDNSMVICSCEDGGTTHRTTGGFKFLYTVQNDTIRWIIVYVQLIPYSGTVYHTEHQAYKFSVTYGGSTQSVSTSTSFTYSQNGVSGNGQIKNMSNVSTGAAQIVWYGSFTATSNATISISNFSYMTNRWSTASSSVKYAIAYSQNYSSGLTPSTGQLWNLYNNSADCRTSATNSLMNTHLSVDGLVDGYASFGQTISLVGVTNRGVKLGESSQGLLDSSWYNSPHNYTLDETLIPSSMFGGGSSITAMSSRWKNSNNSNYLARQNLSLQVTPAGAVVNYNFSDQDTLNLSIPKHPNSGRNGYFNLLQIQYGQQILPIYGSYFLQDTDLQLVRDGTTLSYGGQSITVPQGQFSIDVYCCSSIGTIITRGAHSIITFDSSAPQIVSAVIDSPSCDNMIIYSVVKAVCFTITLTTPISGNYKAAIVYNNGSTFITLKEIDSTIPNDNGVYKVKVYSPFSAGSGQTGLFGVWLYDSNTVVQTLAVSVSSTWMRTQPYNDIAIGKTVMFNPLSNRPDANKERFLNQVLQTVRMYSNFLKSYDKLSSAVQRLIDTSDTEYPILDGYDALVSALIDCYQEVDSHKDYYEFDSGEFQSPLLNLNEQYEPIGTITTFGRNTIGHGYIQLDSFSGISNESLNVDSYSNLQIEHPITQSEEYVVRVTSTDSISGGLWIEADTIDSSQVEQGILQVGSNYQKAILYMIQHIF